SAPAYIPSRRVRQRDPQHIEIDNWYSDGAASRVSTAPRPSITVASYSFGRTNRRSSVITSRCPVAVLWHARQSASDAAADPAPPRRRLAIAAKPLPTAVQRAVRSLPMVVCAPEHCTLVGHGRYELVACVRDPTR